MTRRPLHVRFGPLVSEEIKNTTIREKPWPVGVPIMLFHWQGKPYRLKQVDCAAVVVTETRKIQITRSVLGMGYWEDGTDEFIEGLWKSEGFENRADMDEWFRKLVKIGDVIDHHLMSFVLWKGDTV